MKKASSTRRKQANAPAQKKLEQLELFPKTELNPLQGSKDKPFVAMRQGVQPKNTHQQQLKEPSGSGYKV